MSKMIDETGNTYTYLKVLRRGKNNKSGRAQWICECKCGNIVEVVGSQLRSGKTKSCGCYQKEQTSKSCIKDLTGQEIGNFIVLENIQGNKHSGGTFWRCKCKLCGNENAIICSTNIYKQESCGCTIQSKGERKIKEILEQNNINFIQEKRFSSFKYDNGTQPRYDFYLPDYNCLIEYDGIQHFMIGTGIYDSVEKFAKTQEYDKIKNKWALSNGYNLIRIPYSQLDAININMLLPETSEFRLLI